MGVNWNLGTLTKKAMGIKLKSFKLIAKNGSPEGAYYLNTGQRPV